MPYQYSTSHAITNPITLSRRLCNPLLIQLLGEDKILDYATRGLPGRKRQTLQALYSGTKERVGEMGRLSFFRRSYERIYHYWFLAPEYSTKPLTFVIPQMSAYDGYNVQGKVDHDALSSLRRDIPAIKRRIADARKKFIADKKMKAQDVSDLLPETQIAVLDGLFMPFIVHPERYEEGNPTIAALPRGLRDVYVPHSVHDSAYDADESIERKLRTITRKAERFSLDDEEIEILEKARSDPKKLREEFRLHGRINAGFHNVQLRKFFERTQGTVILLGYRKILEAFGLLDGDVPDPEVFGNLDTRLALVKPGSRNQVYNYMMLGVVSGSGMNALAKHLRNYMEDLYGIYPLRS